MGVYIRERGTRTEYEIPGRMEDGGLERAGGFFLYFLSRGMSNGARPTRDPPVDEKISRGAAAPPDAPGLRLRAARPTSRCIIDDHDAP